MSATPSFKNIIEASLQASGNPLPLDAIVELFAADSVRPKKAEIRQLLAELQADYAGRAMQLVEVASGWRIQVRPEYADWVARLFTEKPPRYSRALLETLAIIAYRQPITRGEIEDIRGVAVSSNIMRSLTERGWVRIVGHRELPGRPALYATAKEFLDYFNLKSLDELPSLAELQDLDQLQLPLEMAADSAAAPLADTTEPQDDEVNEHA